METQNLILSSISNFGYDLKVIAIQVGITSVIEHRLKQNVKISENQFGFMPGRSTTEAILLLCQLVERFRERKRNLHIVFIDLEKAYERCQERYYGGH